MWCLQWEQQNPLGESAQLLVKEPCPLSSPNRASEAVREQAQECSAGLLTCLRPQALSGASFSFLAFYRSIIHIQQNAVGWWVCISMNFHILNSLVYSTPWLTNSITSNPESPQRLTLSLYALQAINILSVLTEIKSIWGQINHSVSLNNSSVSLNPFTMLCNHAQLFSSKTLSPQNKALPTQEAVPRLKPTSPQLLETTSLLFF